MPISDLPPELLDQILDQLVNNLTHRPSVTTRSLYFFSLVCRSFTQPALAALYRRLSINSTPRAAALAQSAALRRYHTQELMLFLSVRHESLSDILGVIDGCEGLGKLVWAGNLDFEFTMRILSRPSLSSLRSLSLPAYLSGANRERGANFIFPCRLNCLTTTLDRSLLPLLETVIAASFTGSASSLTFLDLSQVNMLHPQQLNEISLFNPIASSISSLFLPAIGIEEVDFDPYYLQTSSLLRLSTNLSLLSISTDEWSEQDLIPGTLSSLLTAINHSLKHFIFEAPIDLFSGELFEVLEDMMRLMGAMAKVGEIGVARGNLEELEGVEGWENFVFILEEKGLKLITKTD